ncbi:MAG TPA: TraR/DksA C4-type zinc finger protein [Chryseolinea sp.]|nr:TraR/DksA C4-type zinc finger protein [Chryseolinea sp.]
MAKNKKVVSKAAKKAPAKAKPVAKKKVAAPKAKSAPAKKAAPAPKKAAPKPAAKKAVVAKKAAPKKVLTPKKVEKPVEKPIAAPKIEKVEPQIEKVAPVKKEKVEKPVAVKPAVPVVNKPAPPQLTIFPVPNQRPIAHKQIKPASTEGERTRYSEDELNEFAALIYKKLDKAKDEYKILKETLNRNNDEGTDATSGGNTKVLEDGAETAEKENLSQLAARQQKYIMNLENALIRIKNGTYGICSVTGKLIPKERLIAVPHTTQSIEAKMMQQD